MDAATTVQTVESPEDIAQKVMDHAKANYDDGWDSIYECNTVEELADQVRELRAIPDIPMATAEEAITWFGGICDVIEERRKESERLWSW